MPIDVVPPPPSNNPDDSGTGILVIETAIVVNEAEIPAASGADDPESEALQAEETTLSSETKKNPKATVGTNTKPGQSGFRRSQTVVLCLIFTFLLAF